MNTIIILSIIFLITSVFGLFLTPHIVTLSRKLHLYDMPDSRKVHQLPIPRLGGVVFIPTVIVVISVVLVVLIRLGYNVEALWKGTNIQHFLAYMAGSIMLFAVGLYDDIYGTTYKVKFMIQVIAASLLCISGLWIADFAHVFAIDRVPFWVGMPITILLVVYVTNAMNLIDGIDGLASGLSIIALSVIAILYIVNHELVWSMLSVAFLGVIVSFFYYNVFQQKNKIFMGDAGSLTLGYTLSFLVLHFWQAGAVWNIHLHNIGIIALSTLVIPMLDVVRVFASRIRDGRNPFLPDKNHIHHKFMRAGLGPKATMISILLVSMFIIMCNYFVTAYMSQTLIIVTDIAFFYLMHYIINFFISRRESMTGEKWSREMTVKDK